MPALAAPSAEHLRELDEMGRVTVPIEAANLGDLYLAHRGDLPDGEVRRFEVEALVDTGATMLSLPVNLIEELGLREFVVHDVVRLWVQGRDCSVEVLALPAGCPPLIGQIPLEYMDWVVDPRRRQLIGNPAHGGAWEVEVF